MMLNETLQQQIGRCINDLNALVTGQGFALTDPDVVKKSMELDELILLAMRGPLPQARQA